MYWAAGVTLLQNALMLAVWLSLPLLAGIAVASVAGGLAQSYLGLSDSASLLAPRLIAAALVVACFGTWMLSLTCSYWGNLWLSAAQLVRGP